MNKKKILLSFSVSTIIGVAITAPIIFNNSNNNTYVSINTSSTTINPGIDLNGKPQIDISTSQFSTINIKNITQSQITDIIYEFRNTIFHDLPSNNFEKKHITVESFKVNLLSNSVIVNNIMLSKYKNESNQEVDEFKDFGSLIINGFKTMPDYPSNFPTNQLKDISWINCATKQMYPFEILDSFIDQNPLNSNKQLLENEITEAAKKSLSLNDNTIYDSYTTCVVKLYNESIENLNNYRNTGLYPGLNNGSNDTTNGQLKFTVSFSNVLVNNIRTNKDIEVRVYNAKVINFNNANNNDVISTIDCGTLDNSFTSKYPDQVSVSELQESITNWLNKDRPIDLYSTINIINQPIYHDTSIELQFEMTNNISTNVLAPVIQKKSGPYNLTVTNFSRNNEPPLLSTTPSDAINTPITVSNDWTSKFASDLTYQQVSSFLTPTLIERLFNNLPSDYSSSGKEPRLISYIANDELGTIELSFTLTYYLVDNTAIDGESQAYKIIFNGFKKQEGFKYFDLTYALPNTHMYNIDYISFIKDKLISYVSNNNYFSNSVKNRLLVFLSNTLSDQTANVISIPEIDNHKDTVIYKIPEISNITNDNSWSNGFSITLTDLQYNYNHIIPNSGTLPATFDAFKKDPSIFSINELIEVTNSLPPISVGSSELVKPTFRPGIGDSKTGQGQIIFTFPKFYDRTLGLIENYEVIYNFSFQTENVSITPEIISPFVETLNIWYLNEEWTNKTYDVVLRYLNDENNNHTINEILNSQTVIEKIYTDPDYYKSSIKFHNASIGTDNTLYIVVSSESNNIPFTVKLIGMKALTSPTIFRPLIPPSTINSTNIYDYLELAPSNELMNRVQQFLEISNLPEYATISRVDVYAKMDDSLNSSNDVIYVNYLFDYAYVQIDSTSLECEVKQNYIVQQKLLNISDGASTTWKSEIIYVGPVSTENNHQNQNNITNIICISSISIISILLVFIIIITLYKTTKKYKNH